MTSGDFLDIVLPLDDVFKYDTPRQRCNGFHRIILVNAKQQEYHLHCILHVFRFFALYLNYVVEVSVWYDVLNIDTVISIFMKKI